MFHNKNTTEGMNEVLIKLHTYVPSESNEGNGEEIYNHKIGIVGDQLTIESSINCIFSMANGFTPDERLEGIQAEIAD